MIPSGINSEQFRTWRKRLGLTQRTSAEKLGISVSSVQGYERGKRRDREKPIIIPLITAWAMTAIADGLSPWGSKK